MELVSTTIRASISISHECRDYAGYETPALWPNSRGKYELWLAMIPAPLLDAPKRGTNADVTITLKLAR